MKNSIVVDGVEYFREQPEVTKNQAYVESYDWLKTHIEEMDISDEKFAKLFFFFLSKF